MKSLEEKAKGLADAKQTKSEFDAEKEKLRWLAALDSLYAEIRQWLDPMVKAGQLVVATTQVWLDEEYIGRYQATCMTLDFSGAKIQLVPQGTMIIGSRGRVDFGHQSMKSMLIIQGDWDNAKWAIYPTQRGRSGVELTEEAFKKVLAAMLPG